MLFYIQLETKGDNNYVHKMIASKKYMNIWGQKCVILVKWYFVWLSGFQLLGLIDSCDMSV